MKEACVLPDYSIIPEEALEIAKDPGIIALVGASPKLQRPSHQVMAYLLQEGLKVIPVNPGQEVILGQKCYPNLKSIPYIIDTVVIFRDPKFVLPIIKEALELGIKNIWMQEGVINEEAFRFAKEKGLKVVMNLCLKKVRKIMKY